MVLAVKICEGGVADGSVTVRKAQKTPARWGQEGQEGGGEVMHISRNCNIWITKCNFFSFFNTKHLYISRKCSNFAVVF